MSEQADISTGYAPFWSDDFDMDLLKLWPELPEKLGAMVNVPLWTLGNVTVFRLNHPTCWNTIVGMTAFFWLEQPNLFRDRHGWATLPNGCTTGDPLVETNWLEVLRDAWSHNYAVVIASKVVWDAQKEWPRFEAIMSDLRGWHRQDVAREKAEVWANIMRATAILAGMVEERSLRV